MNKPKKHAKYAYDYHELADYVGEKLGHNLRDYAEKFEGECHDFSHPYLDFWHWLIDQVDIHNGCYIYIPVNHFLEVPATEDKKWISEILDAFKEFQNKKGEVYCWVSW